MSMGPDYPRCYGSHGHSDGINCRGCVFKDGCKNVTGSIQAFEELKKIKDRPFDDGMSSLRVLGIEK